MIFLVNVFQQIQTCLRTFSKFSAIWSQIEKQGPKDTKLIIAKSTLFQLGMIMINFSSDNFTYNVDLHHLPSYSSKS